ncbi:MAG: hypothetical protein U0Y82_10980 [Thermoleophilia bacterium]
MSTVAPVQGGAQVHRTAAPQPAPPRSAEAGETPAQEAAEGGTEAGKGAKVDFRA